MATSTTPRPKKAAPPPPPPRVVTGKLGAIVMALQGADGATLEQLTALTGWQAHSVRGAMAGALKKRGFIIVSAKAEGVRTYRIEEPKR